MSKVCISFKLCLQFKGQIYFTVSTTPFENADAGLGTFYNTYRVKNTLILVILAAAWRIFHILLIRMDIMFDFFP